MNTTHRLMQSTACSSYFGFSSICIRRQGLPGPLNALTAVRPPANCILSHVVGTDLLWPLTGSRKAGEIQIGMKKWDNKDERGLCI